MVQQQPRRDSLAGLEEFQRFRAAERSFLLRRFDAAAAHRINPPPLAWFGIALHATAGTHNRLTEQAPLLHLPAYEVQSTAGLVEPTFRTFTTPRNLSVVVRDDNRTSRWVRWECEAPLALPSPPWGLSKDTPS